MRCFGHAEDQIPARGMKVPLPHPQRRHAIIVAWPSGNASKQSLLLYGRELGQHSSPHCTSEFSLPCGKKQR